MMPTHQQLIGLLAHADPGFVAGDFATRFRSPSGPDGETGSFRYFPGGFWGSRSTSVGGSFRRRGE